MKLTYTSNLNKSHKKTPPRGHGKEYSQNLFSLNLRSRRAFRRLRGEYAGEVRSVRRFHPD